MIRGMVQVRFGRSMACLLLSLNISFAMSDEDASVAKPAEVAEGTAAVVSQDDKEILAAEFQKHLDAAVAAASEKKTEDAIAHGKAAIEIERQLYGESRNVVIPDWQEWLSQQYLLKGDVQAAADSIAEAHRILEKVLGPDHWRSVDARLAFQYTRRLSKLTLSERDELSLAFKNTPRDLMRSRLVISDSQYR